MVRLLLMSQHQTNEWIQVAAGLKNPSMRQLLGAVLSGSDLAEQPAKTQRKDLARWVKIGLLSEAGDRWVLNEQFLERTLASTAATKPASNGIQRFFTGHRLDTLPAKPADRHEVLVYLRDAIIGQDEQLREEQVNERLRVFHPDVALLRRYMADHGLLLRAADGSSYQRGAAN